MTTSKWAPLTGIMVVASLFAASFWRPIGIITAVLFVWFLAVLRRRLVPSGETPGIDSAFALGAGIVALCLFLGGRCKRQPHAIQL